MSSKNIPNVFTVYAGLTNLTRREEFFAERFVVVGPRNLSALVVDVRIHSIDTVIGLFLGEGLEQERKIKSHCMQGQTSVQLSWK